MTLEELGKILAKAPRVRLQAYFPFLLEAHQKAEINSPVREAMFIAQLAHESAEFRYLREIWGPTPAQARYEPPSDLATRLGNTQAGDGMRFMGRGIIQLTGRSNYARAGAALGLDLISRPDLAADPHTAFLLAAWFWTEKKLNVLADLQDIKACTHVINGGYNGLDDRTLYYRQALDVLCLNALNK